MVARISSIYGSVHHVIMLCVLLIPNLRYMIAIRVTQQMDAGGTHTQQMDAGGNASLILSDVKEIGQKRRLEEDDDIISKLWIPPWRKGGPLFNGYGPPPAEYDYTLVTAEVDHEGLGAFKNQPFTSKGFHFAGKLAGLPVHQMCHYTNKTLTDNNQVWNDCSSDSMKHLYMDVLGKSKPPKEGRCLNMGPYGNCMDVWINTPGGTGDEPAVELPPGARGGGRRARVPLGQAPRAPRPAAEALRPAIREEGDHACTALFSIFRRNLQKMNAEKANTRPLTKDERQAITTLDTYLRGQKDVLRFTDHFDRWVQPQRCQGYPIFYVKFGPALWEHLPHFLRFLGVPEKFVPEMVKDIPLERKRKTPHYGENHPNTKKCRAMYKDLYERYDSFPDAAIIQM
eukprot:CAMPEP_0194593062 /NCGR_PEP_ID=MMETSP0292-20121207/23226_1 /TAXON_ID=39354 /ORGANISM="Heterosigma akashiwo, Strain CCMP2393" /LENGTH=397 /DNA_ID=CAMNT_0039451833 /DNA_START=58 /DNA_END=1250 /DNA_ORIENTATION=-